ncbi:mitochondrial fission ELM1 family protein [Acetobacter persici]|uniref:mitochondrial fission ELM1 family protein n=1 Tax=Acetobacter persici TaxID=1076596 RepID=UPI001BA74A63|nr:mitochondrial fission ELM1 family protein [Acetobacter persici]MBS1001016.1 mitochondrial fission ELM1 family protein [Acetobacter persici]
MAEDVYAGKVPGSNPVSALVVGEDFAGMRSQALGLAGRAGWESRFQAVSPSRLARLMLAGPQVLARPFLRTASGARLAGMADLAQADVVISIGGKGGAVGAALRAPGRRPVVQVQNPRQSLDRFDLIVACEHDEITGPNVLLGRTALHGLTPEVLAQARAHWAPRFTALPRPLIAGLVGGSNGRFTFGVPEAHRLGTLLAAAVTAQGGSLIVTPSRRTDPEALRVLTELVEGAGGTVWNGEGDNPYQGLVACADTLVVTMDSVSMVSEAVAGSASVFVFPLPGRSRRITRFLQGLEAAGRIRMLEPESPAQRLTPWVAAPLDDTPELIAEMHRRLGF